MLVAAWVLSILSFCFAIPKAERRKDQIAFLVKQIITWPIGLLVVEFGLIEYPVRLFTQAVKSSFTFEFLVYPVLCAFFIVYYPEAKRKIVQAAYYTAIVSAITAVELLLETHTLLIRYIHWSGLCTGVSLAIAFYLSRQYVRWFFRI